MKLDKKDLLLYAVTDRSWLGEKTLYDCVKAALDGGASFIQLREKNLPYDEFLKEALKIKALCKEYCVPFVINDNVKLAKEIDADGVHIGQNDIDIGMAKKILGNNKIIGVSAQNISQAYAAEERGADYLGVGAIFPTESKSDADNVSIDTLKSICKNINIPVVAIGGINSENISKLEKSGIRGIAVISAIFAQKNITSATKKLRTLTEGIV